MKRMKERVTVTIDREIVNHLKILSKQTGKSFSEIVNEGLKEWYFTKKKESGGKKLLEVIKRFSKEDVKSMFDELKFIRKEGWRE